MRLETTYKTCSQDMTEALNYVSEKILSCVTEKF